MYLRPDGDVMLVRSNEGAKVVCRERVCYDEISRLGKSKSGASRIASWPAVKALIWRQQLR